MLTLFIRAIFLYMLVFIVIRMMGKRQISELQPFDLVFTLLIADLASNPISDTSIPLVYGIIPILALFLLQQGIDFLSLKSERARTLFAGKPQILVMRGVLQEDVMRNANYTISDLLEQLRAKGVFDLTEVSFAIMETDGTLSVLPRGDKQPPNLADLKLAPHTDTLCEMVVQDGKIHHAALENLGFSQDWLLKQLRLMGYADEKELFFATLSPEGTLHAQAYQKRGGAVRMRQIIAGKAAE